MSNFKEKRKLLRLLEEFSKSKSIVYEGDFVSFVGQIGLDKYNKNKKNKDIHLDSKLLIEGRFSLILSGEVKV